MIHHKYLIDSQNFDLQMNRQQHANHSYGPMKNIYENLSYNNKDNNKCSHHAVYGDDDYDDDDDQILNHHHHHHRMTSDDVNEYSEPELLFSNRHHPHQQSFKMQSSHKSSNIVHDILHDLDLSNAGCLFNLSNEVLLHDFPYTIELIKKLVDARSYVSNLNQQSIVEIVLTKCITALKETRLILNYYEDLLDLLEICLKYNLNSAAMNHLNSTSIRNSKRLSVASDLHGLSPCPNSSGSTAHANIVSDILSCILLVIFKGFI
jgi:hypothetical protein